MIFGSDPASLRRLATSSVEARMILILLAAQGMVFTNTKPAQAVTVTGPQPPSTVVNAVPPVRVVTAPQPRAPAQSYFSPDDYPAAATGSGAKGRVSVMLGINVQ